MAERFAAVVSIFACRIGNLLAFQQSLFVHVTPSGSPCRILFIYQVPNINLLSTKFASSRKARDRLHTTRVQRLDTLFNARSLSEVMSTFDGGGKLPQKKVTGMVDAMKAKALKDSSVARCSV
jgi:hypothetical protein